jgi:hypothetical protein
MAEKPKYKFPKSMGVCADKLYELRQKRLAQQKLVTEMEEEEKALKEYIINTLPKSETSGVAGKLARVTITSKEVPQVEDWDAFYKHVKKTGEFELMQRRLSDAAINERWEAGKKVPGVKAFKATSLSLNKV